MKYTEAPIVGVTGTQYTDPRDVRFELALENAERWAEANLPLVVVDSSPARELSWNSPNANWVARALEARGAVVLSAKVPGIATQRQQGTRYARYMGAQKMLTHEPEKVLMASLAPEVTSALDASDVVVVGRTPLAEASLPPVQRRVERLAGWILEQTLDMPHDALAGPRGYTRRGAEELLNYPSQLPAHNNWLYMYLTALSARAAGLPVSGVSVDLIHPNLMRLEETNNPIFDAKRYMQFRLQLDNLLRRPEVKPEAQMLARHVLEGLMALGDDPSQPAYERYFDDLESSMAELGYEK